MIHMPDMSFEDEEYHVSGSASDFLASVLIKTIQGLFTGSSSGSAPTA
ncbi:hypothetical protein GCM10027167_46920 [Nocardia heshunensis]